MHIFDSASLVTDPDNQVSEPDYSGTSNIEKPWLQAGGQLFIPE
jgi:hypothetical protein